MLSTFVILLCVVLLRVQSLPSVETKIYSIKTDLTVLGDKFSVGLYELEFDQDLFVPIGIGYCPNVDCYVPPICPPCDYRDCEGTSARWNASTCQCPRADCSNADQVPVIEIDGPPLNLTVTSSSPYTFLLHAVPTNPCSAILVKWTNVNGIFDTVLGYRLRDQATPLIGPSISGYPTRISAVRNSMLICPGSILYGNSLLMAIGDLDNYPYGGYQFNFTAESIPLPPPKTSSCVVPSEFSSTHGCIGEGETIINTTGKEQRFILQLDKRCGTLQFVSTIFNLLISTNPWVSPVNSSGASKAASIDQFTEPFSGEPGVLYYCLEDGQDLFAWVELNENWKIFLDTSETWLQNTPITSISAFDMPRFTLGAVTVQCEDKNFTAWKYSPSYIEPIDAGSANLKVLYPHEEPNPFSSFTFFNNYEWRVSPNRALHGSAISKRLNIALILSQNLVPRLQPVFPIQFPHDYEYLPTDQFSTCQVKLNGLLRNEQNEPILLTISNFNPKETKCSAGEFERVFSEINELLAISLELIQDENPAHNNLVQLLFLRFSIDVLTASDAFYICQKEIETNYVTLKKSISKLETNRCLASFGTSNFLSDPCCYSKDNSFSACEIENRSYTSFSYTPLVESDCPSSICANDALTHYFSEKERIKQSCSDPPQVDKWDKNSLRFFFGCQTQIFGYNSKSPTPCNHDLDCPSRICNSLTKNCLGNVTALEEQFLECLISNATLFSLVGISNQLGVNFTEISEIFDLWWPELQIVTPCSAVAHDVPAGHTQLVYGTGVPPTCIYCTSVSLNPLAISPGESSLFPWDCFAASQPCSGGKSVLPGVAECFGSFTCNYDRDIDPFGTDGACTKTGSFCGFSENQRDATDLSSMTSIASCDTSIVCILANGTKILVSSLNECEQTMSCDLCPGCTEAQCLDEGRCSDSTDPIYSIFSGNIFQNTTGGCLTQIRYQSPWVDSLDFCVYPLRSTVLGCMIFPPLVNEASCNDPTNLFGFSENLVYKGDSTWISRATTEGECLATKACREVPRTSSIESSYSDIFVVPKDSTCSGQGKYGNLWTWVIAKWRGGQTRIPSVMTYGLIRTYSGGPSQGLDVTRILDLIETTTDQELVLLIGSSLFCEHHLKTHILQSLVCSCSNHLKEDICFIKEVNHSTQTKIGVVCGGKATTISSPPAWIILQDNSSDPGECLSILISNLHVSTYAPRPSGLLTLLLIQSSFDYSYSIENPNDETFGKLITDGFSMEDKHDHVLKNVRICILKLRELDSRLPVLDLARLLNSGKFEPLFVNVSDYGDRYCADVPEISTDQQAYFFIQRTEGDWLNPPSVGFTYGERVYIGVLLALYCIGLIIVTIVLIRHIIVNFDVDRMLFIILVMEAFFICRIVLFSLALSNISATQRDPAAGYLLIEFPILLFFCFVSFFVIAWGLILWSQNDVLLTQKNFVKLVNIVVILFNTIIFGLFILMIILFQTVVDPPYYICADTQVVVDYDVSRALSLSYRVIFSTVAIVLGIALLIVGVFMVRLTSDKDLEIATKTLIQVLIATFVGTFGLLAQAIYYLVIVIVGNKQSVYLTLSILLVDEVIPALIFTTLAIVTTPGSKGLSGFLTKMTSPSKESSVASKETVTKN